MKTNNQSVTRGIHWGMAALILSMLVLGFYMKNTQSYEFYALHKSFGVVAIMAICARLYWRIKQPWQSYAKDTKYQKLVTVVHLFILLLLVLMPLSGVILSGFGGYGVALFGMHLIPENLNAAGQVQPFHKGLSDLGYASHTVLGYILSSMVALHILAALKHHFIDKDITLVRMLGKSS
ncbi:cytochrome b [Paraglaciecola sp.]|uniref:cytochrome b n=1 Tax=Paraglaciecola sp. TaxID=1920173 RepID=UPI003EF0AE3A